MTPMYSILDQFSVSGTFSDVQNDSHGFINNTYIVSFKENGRTTRYVLQRVNHYVFRYPEDVMSNLRIISDHIEERLRQEKSTRRFEVTHIVQTKDGRDFFREEDGNVWRLVTYIEHACAFDRLQDNKHAEECGRTLGRFLDLVSDIDISKIRQTIPGYHQPSNYLKQYDEAPKDEEPAEMREFVKQHRDAAVELEQAQAAGVLMPRLIHGDPRINNIMLDERTGEGVAMIDLDTASVGLVQMDVGDAVRSLCNPAGEDVQFIEDVTFCRAAYESFMRGFYVGAGHFLTKADREYMDAAVRLLPFELGLRFLTDHLNGDKYFKVQNHGQNLRRAMGQFKLCELIERG